jgi:glycosyltransferase involved in cell wall biosynthesis
LKAHVPDATLVMAGQDKGMRAAMAELARSLGVLDSVEFPGFLNMEGKFREGNAADIFISTSTTDNMPVAIVEACAMGIPVVTTRVGGTPDLLTEGETGLFVGSDDDEAMCGAILRLLNDSKLAARLSRNGRELAMRSSWPEVKKQWEQVFAETLRSREHEVI